MLASTAFYIANRRHFAEAVTLLFTRLLDLIFYSKQSREMLPVHLALMSSALKAATHLVHNEIFYCVVE